MKILHLHKGFYLNDFGGVERMAFELSKATQKNGCKNVVITISNNTYFERDIKNVKVINFKRDFSLFNNPFSLNALIHFYKIQKKSDIVHLHYPNPFSDLALLLTKKPTLITYHSDIVGYDLLFRIYKFFRDIFYKNVSAFVFTSDIYLSSSKQLSEQIVKKSHVIPIGISKLSTEKIKAKNKNKYFLMVCQIRKYKGLDILFKIDTRSFGIKVIGGGHKLNYYKKKSKALKKDIYFLGNVNESKKNSLLADCIGVISTSNLRSEAFGISLLEGMMHGKPLISMHNNTGTSLLNINDFNGYEFEDGDENELQKYLELLANNADKRSLLGQNSKKRYLELFRAELMAERYIALYKQLLK